MVEDSKRRPTAPNSEQSGQIGLIVSIFVLIPNMDYQASHLIPNQLICCDAVRVHLTHDTDLLAELPRKDKPICLSRLRTFPKIPTTGRLPGASWMEDATCGQNRHLSRVSQGSPSFLKTNLSHGRVVPESPYPWFHGSGRSRQISGPRSSSASPSCPVSLLIVSEPLSMGVSKKAHLHYMTPKPNRGWEVFI